MQEASSVTKAIEQGWLKAGKPQEFTVKVFEEAQKNFFGFTVKSAKVGIFFTESFTQPARGQSRPQRSESHQRPERPQRPEQKRTQRDTVASHHPSEKIVPRQLEPKSERPVRTREHEERVMVQEVWTDELVQETRLWLTDALSALNLPATSFETVADQAHLTITFNRPLSTDSQKEKIIFRSISFLLMQALRHTFKRRLKRLKVTACSMEL